MTDSATSSQGLGELGPGDAGQGPDPDAREVAGQTADDLDTSLDGQDQDPDADPDNPDDGPAEDLEEIDHDGTKYQVPRQLKDAFLRQADYTRKTQELAELRRGLEQQAQQQQQVSQERIQAEARLVAMDDQVQSYEQIDWNALEQMDPARAQSMWREYSQLKDGRAQLAARLSWYDQQKAVETQRATARRLEEGQQKLAQDIPGWSPELASKLSTFAIQEFGFSPQELGTVDDPRMIKVLHLAHLGAQAQKTQTAAKRAAQTQTAQPARIVGSKAGAASRPSTTSPASDRTGTDDWMALERERLRRKGGR